MEEIFDPGGEGSHDAVGGGDGNAALQEERCHEPGCDGMLEQHSDGLVCTTCGVVAEQQSQLQSEVMFDADGRGHFGTFVRDSVASGGGTDKAAAGEHSSVAARKIVGLMAAQLRCVELAEAALRTLREAAGAGFTRGRRLDAVCAACLYHSCRIAGTDHMLLDFADYLQRDVFRLGAVFLRLLRCLPRRALPLADPALFLRRFALRLQLGEHTEAVARAAVRVAARMDRDWLATGRRPAGVSGAALLVACRLYGCRRETWEVVQVARICQHTLRRRVNEFLQTPSAELSLEEFERLDLEEGGDPPCFEPEPPELTWEQLAEQTRQAQAALREPELSELAAAREGDEAVTEGGRNPRAGAENDEEGEEEELSELSPEEAREYLWHPAMVQHRRARWEALVGPGWDAAFAKRQAAWQAAQHRTAAARAEGRTGDDSATGARRKRGRKGGAAAAAAMVKKLQRQLQQEEREQEVNEEINEMHLFLDLCE